MKFIKNQMVASVATGKRYQVVRDTPEAEEFVEVYAIAMDGISRMVTTLAPVSAVVAVIDGQK